MKKTRDLGNFATPKKNRKKAGVTTLLLICLLLLAMTFIFEYTFNEQVTWVPGQGEITDCKEETYYDVQLFLKTRYEYTVRYINEDGETVESIIETETEEGAVGETVDIIYDPDGDGAAFGGVRENEELRKVRIARYALIGIGGILAVVWIVMGIRKKK